MKDIVIKSVSVGMISADIEVELSGSMAVYRFAIPYFENKILKDATVNYINILKSEIVKYFNPLIL